MAQLAIDAAEGGDYDLISELYELLKRPYNEQPENEKWFAKRPEWARHKWDAVCYLVVLDKRDFDQDTTNRIG